MRIHRKETVLKDDAKNRENKYEESQDKTLTKEDDKKKARLRRRGPYRKAHADW
jgi:hypothetical protein